MNEEEKKAIEIIKKEITKPETTPLEVYVTDIKMLLHIINKQQKEIEIWEETENDYEHELARKDAKIENQQKEIEELKINLEKLEVSFALSINDRDSKAEMLKNSIANTKIKDKIKYLEDLMILFTNDKEKFNRYKYARDILEKLLGE